MSAASGRAAPGAGRLGLSANPMRLLFSASLWRAAGFLLTYLLVSGVLFGISLAAGVVAVALAITIVAVPLLIGAAWVIRGCATFERLRLRQVLGESVPAGYPAPERAGLWQRAKTMWLATATWRDLAYLVGLWPVLLGLDAVVFAVWAGLLAGITFPTWYSRVRGMCIGSCSGQNAPGLMIGQFPHGPHGLGVHGVYVDSLHATLVVAASMLLLFLIFNYVLVSAARLHALVAGTVLRQPSDPLAPARQVLASPGPLGPLTSAGR